MQFTSEETNNLDQRIDAVRKDLDDLLLLQPIHQGSKDWAWMEKQIEDLEKSTKAALGHLEMRIKELENNYGKYSRGDSIPCDIRSASGSACAYQINHEGIHSWQIEESHPVYEIYHAKEFTLAENEKAGLFALKQNGGFVSRGFLTAEQLIAFLKESLRQLEFQKTGPLCEEIHQEYGRCLFIKDHKDPTHSWERL